MSLLRRWIDHKALVTSLLLAAILALVPAIRTAAVGGLQWVWAAATHRVPVPVWLLAALVLAAGIPMVRALRARRKRAFAVERRRLSRADLTDLQWACLLMLARAPNGVQGRIFFQAFRDVNAHRVEEELGSLMAAGLVARHRIFEKELLLTSQGRRLLMAEDVI